MLFCRDERRRKGSEIKAIVGGTGGPTYLKSRDAHGTLTDSGTIGI